MKLSKTQITTLQAAAVIAVSLIVVFIFSGKVAHTNTIKDIAKNDSELTYLGKVVSSGPLYNKTTVRGTSMKLDNGKFIGIINVLDFVSPGVKVSSKRVNDIHVYCLDNGTEFECFNASDHEVQAF